MNYHCMVNAFALAMEIGEAELVVRIGHDGLQNFPDTAIPRTHHVQEMIDVGAELGCIFTPIELVPVSIVRDGDLVQYPLWFGKQDDLVANFTRFKGHLKTGPGVILGSRLGSGHAVYWDGEKCIDKSGEFELWGDGTDFEPGVFWRVLWIA